MVRPEPTIDDAIARLRTKAPSLFGVDDLTFTVLHAGEREASTVARVAVRGPGLDTTVFVKVFKPRKKGQEGWDEAQRWVVQDYEVASRVYRALAGNGRFAAVRPLACFPEALAVVTAEASGVTLLHLLERRARWWPSPAALGALEEVLASVGGWLRAFQAIDGSSGRFSLEQMRDYIDVRLRRLLETTPPALDAEGRARVLRYFDATAAGVAPGDLGLVLTHADLAPSNVLIDGSGVTVIDFAMAAPGGVYMDVARLYTQLEFLTAKPMFRPSVVRRLQQALLRGFDPDLTVDRPLFRLFVLQHLLCHMSNIARNPAPALSRLYNRHQLRLRRQWLESFAA